MSYYLFIDGAYFHEAFSSAMSRFFGTVPAINYRDLAGRFQHPKRIYYYDAVDRNQSGAESFEQRDARVSERDKFHAYLNSLPLWHVREGFVSRGRRASRRSQKAVDVQLAVDALEHAVARNMIRAGFILGDLDFEPLLFSLNRFGVETTIWYERETASDELLEAGDISYPLTLDALWGMSSPAFQSEARSPAFHSNVARPENSPLERTGIWSGRSVELLGDNSGGHMLWVGFGGDPIREPSFLVHHPSADPGLVELAFTMTYGGDIVWR